MHMGSYRIFLCAGWAKRYDGGSTSITQHDAVVGRRVRSMEDKTNHVRCGFIYLPIAVISQLKPVSLPLVLVLKVMLRFSAMSSTYTDPLPQNLNITVVRLVSL